MKTFWHPAKVESAFEAKGPFFASQRKTLEAAVQECGFDSAVLDQLHAEIILEDKERNDDRMRGILDDLVHQAALDAQGMSDVDSRMRQYAKEYVNIRKKEITLRAKLLYGLGKEPRTPNVENLEDLFAYYRLLRWVADQRGGVLDESWWTLCFDGDNLGPMLSFDLAPKPPPGYAPPVRMMPPPPRVVVEEEEKVEEEGEVEEEEEEEEEEKLEEEGEVEEEEEEEEEEKLEEEGEVAEEGEEGVEEKDPEEGLTAVQILQRRVERKKQGEDFVSLLKGDPDEETMYYLTRFFEEVDGTAQEAYDGSFKVFQSAPEYLRKITDLPTYILANLATSGKPGNETQFAKLGEEERRELLNVLSGIRGFTPRSWELVRDASKLSSLKDKMAYFEIHHLALLLLQETASEIQNVYKYHGHPYRAREIDMDEAWSRALAETDLEPILTELSKRGYPTSWIEGLREFQNEHDKDEDVVKHLRIEKDLRAAETERRQRDLRREYRAMSSAERTAAIAQKDREIVNMEKDIEEETSVTRKVLRRRGLDLLTEELMILQEVEYQSSPEPKADAEEAQVPPEVEPEVEPEIPVKDPKPKAEAELPPPPPPPPPALTRRNQELLARLQELDPTFVIPEEELTKRHNELNKFLKRSIAERGGEVQEVRPPNPKRVPVEGPPRRVPLMEEEGSPPREFYLSKSNKKLLARVVQLDPSFAIPEDKQNLSSNKIREFLQNALRAARAERLRKEEEAERLRKEEEAERLRKEEEAERLRKEEAERLRKEEELAQDGTESARRKFVEEIMSGAVTERSRELVGERLGKEEERAQDWTEITKGRLISELLEEAIAPRVRQEVEERARFLDEEKEREKTDRVNLGPLAFWSQIPANRLTEESLAQRRHETNFDDPRQVAQLYYLSLQGTPPPELKDAVTAFRAGQGTSFVPDSVIIRDLWRGIIHEDLENLMGTSSNQMVEGLRKWVAEIPYFYARRRELDEQQEEQAKSIMKSAKKRNNPRLYEDDIAREKEYYTHADDVDEKAFEEVLQMANVGVSDNFALQGEAGRQNLQAFYEAFNEFKWNILNARGVYALLSFLYKPPTYLETQVATFLLERKNEYAAPMSLIIRDLFHGTHHRELLPLLDALRKSVDGRDPNYAALLNPSKLVRKKATPVMTRVARGVGRASLGVGRLVGKAAVTGGIEAGKLAGRASLGVARLVGRGGIEAGKLVGRTLVAGAGSVANAFRYVRGTKEEGSPILSPGLRKRGISEAQEEEAREEEEEEAKEEREIARQLTYSDAPPPPVPPPTPATLIQRRNELRAELMKARVDFPGGKKALGQEIRRVEEELRKIGIPPTPEPARVRTRR